jgi:ribosomal protein S18 acetylase RimI-like enzyme
VTLLRDAVLADFPAVWRLLGQLGYAPDEAEFRRRFDSVLAADGHRLIVAGEEGAVAGVLHVFERAALDKGCEAVVQALVVDDTMRSRGVGEALMREAEAWAAGRGLAATSLYTRIDRDRARAFYERIGFRLKATSHLLGRP